MNPHTLLAVLQDMHQQVQQEGERTFKHWQPDLVRKNFRPSALNLASYLALRRMDLRELQQELGRYGLSTLGRSESRVLLQLQAVLATLHALTGEPYTHPASASWGEGSELLRSNTLELLGEASTGTGVRLMVTLPTEAATDAQLVRDLLEHGMDVARINLAHDDETVWLQMVEQVRSHARELGRSCRIVMDLGGPKLRTSRILAGTEKRLKSGDVLNLYAKDASDPVAPAVWCSLPEALKLLEVGSEVWFDDGKMRCVVEEVLPDRICLRVKQTRSKGYKLKAEKGINFPHLDLLIPALTAKDVLDLPFVVEHADLVAFSFVQTPEDVQSLQQHLNRLERPDLGLILKIETGLAVRHLPELMVQAASHQPTGVMIARGDLAVEVGFERLAEVQEEILWLCEAAHIPVVWATQVLESLVKEGVPSRAEITDAAMAERAECVMLNKGPCVVQAMDVLQDVFGRMQAHQHKKTAQLRRLRLAGQAP
ncbi:pyruvate kinase [Deinococcus cellulosilyticus]|uniref:Pyruvate kinase n=1 Tax=Deinococcus cellulosilyticus (strain DSM 18568 / NBRC 106333 / KACC 11606 / 5516J-15) TaxID=1223518 RepID=A0A511MVB8_DEIC1|nr:pyruvate kinase [Deinococcus cellulosilyticus]GEM44523.1 pyruvate kinase [Deinococcus cellulosilyticus NBRC 106333 = KACC 11606]